MSLLGKLNNTSIFISCCIDCTNNFVTNVKLNNDGSVSRWLKLGNRTMIWLGLGLAVRKKQFATSPKYLKW